MASDDLVPDSGTWVIDTLENSKSMFEVTRSYIERQYFDKNVILLSETVGDYLGMNLVQVLEGIAALY